MKQFIFDHFRSLVRSRRYHLSSFSEQLTLETHLSEQLPRWGIDLVIDVGANVGQYGRMLRSIGYIGEIVSVEPSSGAFQALKEASQIDKNWKVFQTALGDSEGEIVLQLSESSVFNSVHSLNAIGVVAFSEDVGEGKMEKVGICRLETFLDDHVESFGKRRVLLKMDTQGHDHAVFAGAGRYQSKFAALQSELSMCPIYEGVPTYLEMLAVYQGAGYGITGLFAVNRLRTTGHAIEYDCVMVPRDLLAKGMGAKSEGICATL